MERYNRLARLLHKETYIPLPVGAAERVASSRQEFQGA
jgi:hypothetical protein